MDRERGEALIKAQERWRIILLSQGATRPGLVHGAHYGPTLDSQAVKDILWPRRQSDLRLSNPVAR